MADFDVRCVNCLHKSHEGKECPYCPMPTKDNPDARCKDFTRADLFIARCMARMEQHTMQAHGQLMMGLSTMFDLLAEAYPEAATRLQVKLEEQRAKAEAEIEARQKELREEADAALASAKDKEEQQFMDTLAEEYIDSAKSNVLPFPVKTEAVIPSGGELA